MTELPNIIIGSLYNFIMDVYSKGFLRIHVIYVKLHALANVIKSLVRPNAIHLYQGATTILRLIA
jgi:hypothetical protein